MSNSDRKSALKLSKIWVVKIGSALLTDPKAGLNVKVIANLVDQIINLKEQGVSVLLVSSGSIAEGLHRLKIDKRPKELHKLQAAAAVGQMGLIHSYEVEFKRHQKICAQVLLTHADLTNRMRYLNARRTLQTLLEMGAIPIINENDTVVNDEIRVGDNDTLGALVANLVEADALILLTDQNGLYTADPRLDSNAKLIESGDAGDDSLIQMAGEGGELGTGGMVTKLHAAQKAARSGTVTVIINGNNKNALAEIHTGKASGTWLFPKNKKLAARKQWISGQARQVCRLVIDQGAVKVLKNEGRSLLPIGIIQVVGEFERGDSLLVVDASGQEIAHGLVNYSAKEARKIKGIASAEIEKILGYVDDPEMIHRNNLVVF